VIYKIKGYRTFFYTTSALTVTYSNEHHVLTIEVLQWLSPCLATHTESEHHKYIHIAIFCLYSIPVFTETRFPDSKIYQNTYHSMLLVNSHQV